MPLVARIAVHGQPEQVLVERGIELPPVRRDDLAAMRRVGQVLYTPGVLPWWGEELRYMGAVDDARSIRDAYRAAQLCMHNIIGLVRAELGSLDRVQQLFQLNVLVACSDRFENPGRGADGTSEAAFKVFAAGGRHRRDVVATRELTAGAPVQVSAILRVQ